MHNLASCVAWMSWGYSTNSPEIEGEKERENGGVMFVSVHISYHLN